MAILEYVFCEVRFNIRGTYLTEIPDPCFVLTDWEDYVIRIIDNCYPCLPFIINDKKVIKDGNIGVKLICKKDNSTHFGYEITTATPIQNIGNPIPNTILFFMKTEQESAVIIEAENEQQAIKLLNSYLNRVVKLIYADALRDSGYRTLPVKS